MKEDSIIKGLWFTFLLDRNLRVIDSFAGIRPGSSRRNLETVETKSTTTQKWFLTKKSVG